MSLVAVVRVLRISRLREDPDAAPLAERGT